MPEGPLKVKIGGTYEFVDIAGGQKTGAYLDVRHVPALLDPVYEGAKVLDCFSYQGHFTLHALGRGAAEVTGDRSVAGRARPCEGESLHQRPARGKVTFRCGNAFDIMREIDATARGMTS